jgi:hypothetical protein
VRLALTSYSLPRWRGQCSSSSGRGVVIDNGICVAIFILRLSPADASTRSATEDIVPPSSSCFNRICKMKISPPLTAFLGESPSFAHRPGQLSPPRGGPLLPPSLLAPLLPLRHGGAATMADTGCCGLEHTKEAWSSHCGSRRRGSARWCGAPAVDLGGAELATGSHGRAGIQSRWCEGRGGLVAGSRASGRRRRGAAPAAGGGRD